MTRNKYLDNTSRPLQWRCIWKKNAFLIDVITGWKRLSHKRETRTGIPRSRSTHEQRTLPRFLARCRDHRRMDTDKRFLASLLDSRKHRTRTSPCLRTLLHRSGIKGIVTTSRNPLGKKTCRSLSGHLVARRTLAILPFVAVVAETAATDAFASVRANFRRVRAKALQYVLRWRTFVAIAVFP